MAGVEADVERTTCERALKEYGIKNIKLKQAGWPDRLFVLNEGTSVFIEFKQPGEKPDPLQQYTLDMLRKLGHHAYWYDCVDEALAKLIEILEIINGENTKRR